VGGLIRGSGFKPPRRAIILTPLLKQRAVPRALRLLASFLALLAVSDAGWAQEVQKHVLLLHSARRDSVLAETADRELSRLLDLALNGALDYFPEYVDTARFPDRQYRDAFRNFLRLKYKNQRFDLVIALENTPLDFTQLIRDDLSPQAPVIFSAYEPAVRRIPNSTGLIDQPDFSRTLGLALQLQPDTRQVYVVSGTSSRDKFYERLARARFKSFEPSLEFTYLSVGGGFRGTPNNGNVFVKLRPKAERKRSLFDILLIRLSRLLKLVAEGTRAVAGARHCRFI